MTTFLRQILGKIYLSDFLTTLLRQQLLVLYHSRYGFRQIHFRHLVFHVRLLSNMIIEIRKSDMTIGDKLKKSGHSGI